MEYTIELDCPPGSPRPGDLLPGVVAGTGLPVREPVSMVFGNWVWDYSDMPDVFAAAQATLKSRIKALYHAGQIRYGSW